jgi:lipid-binding SYLF domain-containing protein
MVKIAVGFGGSHGKGVASCRLENDKWSEVAPVTITGGSWGLQLGGQAVDLVMIVMNDDGMLTSCPANSKSALMRRQLRGL